MDHDAILRAVVKPLVWGPSLAGFCASDTGFGGKIEIMWDQSPAHGISFVLQPGTQDRQRFKTFEEAEVAANSFNRARIAAALHVDLIEALVDGIHAIRMRLELIADEAWHGDGRDLKRSIVGVFADYDAALAVIRAAATGGEGG